MSATTSTAEVTLTVREFIDGKAPTGHDVFLPTWNGEHRVSYVDQFGWAHCPEDNGGFGMSYCVHYGMLLVARPRA